MDLYPNYERLYDPQNNVLAVPTNLNSKNLPTTVKGWASHSTLTGSVCAIKTRFTTEYLYLDQTGPYINIKRITEQEVKGGVPAIKGLKGNVNHDVINELSLAGVDYMQGNIFNQLFVQGAL